MADYWRRHYQRPLASLDNHPEISAPTKTNEEDLELQMAKKELWVRKILGSLPKNYRQVLELRFLKNYTLQEIADELDLTLGNVKVIQYRALKKACDISKNL